MCIKYHQNHYYNTYLYYNTYWPIEKENFDWSIVLVILGIDMCDVSDQTCAQSERSRMQFDISLFPIMLQSICISDRSATK